MRGREPVRTAAAMSSGSRSGYGSSLVNKTHSNTPNLRTHEPHTREPHTHTSLHTHAHGHSQTHRKRADGKQGSGGPVHVRVDVGLRSESENAIRYFKMYNLTARHTNRELC